MPCQPLATRVYFDVCDRRRCSLSSDATTPLIKTKPGSTCVQTSSWQRRKACDHAAVPPHTNAGMPPAHPRTFRPLDCGVFAAVLESVGRSARLLYPQPGIPFTGPLLSLSFVCPLQPLPLHLPPFRARYRICCRSPGPSGASQPRVLVLVGFTGRRRSLRLQTQRFPSSLPQRRTMQPSGLPRRFACPAGARPSLTLWSVRGRQRGVVVKRGCVRVCVSMPVSACVSVSVCLSGCECVCVCVRLRVHMRAFGCARVV